ncbi:MAG: DNA topoisomerase 3, partial [Clostridia bacterium]|nr:DNA topoisomerase 3 [Clostridia bacterium]
MKLVIAEKPSVAAEIAKVIGATKKEKGFYTGEKYIVSWCVGHLVETVMPEAYDPQYAKWRADRLPIIPTEWKYKVTPQTHEQFDTLKGLMERPEVDELVCATDAGREGELIFRLVYNQTGCSKPFRRLWISSMETKAIKDGFEKLKEGSAYDRLYDAALSRMQADWLVGINFSRLFGCLSNRRVNIGRVQTPTVNLIVERQRSIDAFDSKPYYILSALCNDGTSSFSATKRVDDRSEAEAIVKKCDGKTAMTVSVKKTAATENPQALYDLTTLQRDANKLLAMSAQETLDATQNLYEKKLVTYPRTDSRYLTSDMTATAEGILKSLLSAPYIDAATARNYDASKADIQKLVNDKKVTDHHAIIPTIEAHKMRGNLPAPEINILMLVSYRLLTAAYIPHEYVKTEVVLDIEGEEFRATGRTITEEGFRAFAHNMQERLKEANPQEGKKSRPKKNAEEGEDVIIPPLAEGQLLENVSLSSKEKATRPPKPYTEDTLLSAMENAMRTLEDEQLKKDAAGAGLGTPATRAGIIERIIKTGFVERKGKNLLPTQKAYDVVDIVPEKVKSAVMTAEWEQRLDLIYKGKAEAGEFVSGIQDFVSEMVAEYTKNCVFSEEGREIIGKCPRCGKNVFEWEKSYSCEDRECGFVIWKSNRGLEALRKPLTKPMVKAFLEKGAIKAVNLYSAKKEKYFNACIVMQDEDGKVSFRLTFPKGIKYDVPKPAAEDGAQEAPAAAEA